MYVTLMSQLLHTSTLQTPMMRLWVEADSTLARLLEHTGTNAGRHSSAAAAQPNVMPQVEAGTPFARWQAAGRLSFPDDEAGADMYRDASHMLRQVPYP